MTRLLLKWLVVALTVLAVPHLVSGFRVESLGTALALALVLGFLNLLLKPVLIFLTFPFTLVTFGFFLLVINALVFWISAETVSGVEVDSFGAAFFASLLVSLVSWVFSLSMRREGGKVQWKFEKVSPSRSPEGSPIDLEKDTTGRWS